MSILSMITNFHHGNLDASQLVSEARVIEDYLAEDADLDLIELGLTD